jgi:hypothetical protein
MIVTKSIAWQQKNIAIVKLYYKSSNQCTQKDSFLDEELKTEFVKPEKTAKCYL